MRKYLYGLMKIRFLFWIILFILLLITSCMCAVCLHCWTCANECRCWKRPEEGIPARVIGSCELPKTLLWELIIKYTYLPSHLSSPLMNMSDGQLVESVDVGSMNTE